ncbi:hypothetical protein [Stackebrandtia nassauensis]|uniref:Uncharacterized protein n=1 Tax=Stackebrandtia nassauensis (strain DSM 44728 / CIP 108903 / NRRL B-16338 / NBRC 102104 / LLR-40K-21) TaxID=446470 RepID=D3Q021_STANL|nr:hypothetical protein [Stackebrandtia nassauensis]ADD45550.1 hypothetical protein Snas_5922 [Stackebrandtia nassauensis DSM 44728]
MVSWEAPDAPENLFHSFTVEIWLDEGSHTGDTAHRTGSQSWKFYGSPRD